MTPTEKLIAAFSAFEPDNTPDQIEKLANLAAAIAGLFNPPLAEVAGVELVVDETPGLILAELRKQNALLAETMVSVPSGHQLIGDDGPEWGFCIRTAVDRINAAREASETASAAGAAAASAAATTLRPAAEQIPGSEVNALLEAMRRIEVLLAKNMPVLHGNAYNLPPAETYANPSVSYQTHPGGISDIPGIQRLTP